MTQPTPPAWRRPPGVSAGTWEYANQRSIADHYDAFVADTPLCQSDLQVLCEQFPATRPDPPTWILDLGCGTGRTAVPLSERGFQVVAVDLSRRMLQRLKEKTSANELASSVFPVRANLVQLECFADQSIDHAVCMFSTLGMIQGRQHRSQMLASVRRILKPGGRFVVHVHNRWSALRERSGVRKLAWSWVRSWRESDYEFGDATYAYRGITNMFMHRFSKREIVRSLKEVGFQITETVPLTIDGHRGSPLIPGGFILIARN